MLETGADIHKLCHRLYPICRSITGKGVRESLSILQEYLPNIKIQSVPSGTQVFDWTVPDEWNIDEAYVENMEGERVIDFRNHNLHVVNYSTPVDLTISLEELQKHLYSLPEQPNAIPYITSYYAKRWGFCLKHVDREKLKEGDYKVVIKSSLKPGVLNYGELIIPGKSDKEIFISTYVCHPSMANNELSGPTVTAALAKWIEGLDDRLYTYRIVFIPETIGSITYLSQNLKHLQKSVAAGFNVTCIGDERCYSYLPSRDGNTLSDRVAKQALKEVAGSYKSYSWFERGSDERQYCAPGVNLPIATIMRSKFGEYPEYHTSLDDLQFVTPEGLAGGLRALKAAIKILETNIYFKMTVCGEPQLGKRGLFPTLGTKEDRGSLYTMMNFISLCDGKNSLLDISEALETSVDELKKIGDLFMEHGLMEKYKVPCINGE